MIAVLNFLFHYLIGLIGSIFVVAGIVGLVLAFVTVSGGFVHMSDGGVGFGLLGGLLGPILLVIGLLLLSAATGTKPRHKPPRCVPHQAPKPAAVATQPVPPVREIAPTKSGERKLHAVGAGALPLHFEKAVGPDAGSTGVGHLDQEVNPIALPWLGIYREGVSSAATRFDEHAVAISAQGFEGALARWGPRYSQLEDAHGRRTKVIERHGRFVLIQHGSRHKPRHSREPLMAGGVVDVHSRHHGQGYGGQRHDHREKREGIHPLSLNGQPKKAVPLVTGDRRAA